MSQSESSEILLPKLTRREFRERMQSGELKACIIPVAATEQHLEHLAMEHDWRSVMLVATEAGRLLAPEVLVAPSMNIGISEHHMRHPGTLSALPGSWLSVLFDTIRSMHHAGFKKHPGAEWSWWKTLLPAWECGDSSSSGWKSICISSPTGIYSPKRSPWRI